MYYDLVQLKNLDRLREHPNILAIIPYDSKYDQDILLKRQPAPDYLLIVKGKMNPVPISNAKVTLKWPVNPNLSNIIAIDKKNFVAGYGSAPNLVVVTTKKDYLKILDRFCGFYQQHVNKNDWVCKAFINEIMECKNNAEAQIVWGNYLYQFNPVHPPLWIETNFEMSYLTKEGLEIGQKQEYLIHTVSEELYKMRIPDAYGKPIGREEFIKNSNFRSLLEELEEIKNFLW